jgi:hypothetical protein
MKPRFDNCEVELVALRQAAPASVRVLQHRRISANQFSRLTLRSATGFSQRENRHHP